MAGWSNHNVRRVLSSRIFSHGDVDKPMLQTGGWGPRPRWLLLVAGFGTRYLAIRIATALVTFFIAISLVFLMIRLTPGDPVSVLFGSGASLSAEQWNEVRESLGLDRPMHVQYVDFMEGVVTGDLGESFRFQESVLDLIVERMPATLILMLMSMSVGTTIGVVLGRLSARFPNSPLDKSIRLIALVAYSMPDFWIALLLLLGLSFSLGIFPIGGSVDIGLQRGTLSWFLSFAWHAVLPVSTLSLYYIALFARYTRTSLLEQATENYVLTARAKGLSWRRTFNKHVFRNSLLPLITLSGISLTYLFGGAVVVESVFSWPGIGLLMFDALRGRDFPVLQGVLIFASATVIIVNLLLDLVYAAVDPRTREVRA